MAAFQECLWSACEIAKESLGRAQTRMKAQYDKKAVELTFMVRDQVLVLTPMQGDRLGGMFCGHYSILKRVGNYMISTPGQWYKTRLCHINRLKPYYPCGKVAVAAISVSSSLSLDASQSGSVKSSRFHPIEEKDVKFEPVGAHLDNAAYLKELSTQLGNLSLEQQGDV